MIGGANSFEAVLEAALEAGEDVARWDGVVVVGLEQVHGQRGHERAREDVGGEHREDDGFGERNEEIARDAAQEEHRQEDDADAERGDESGNGDLRCAFEDGVVQAVTLFEVAFDVFDGDGGVVDEDADGESQTAEGHDVDGLAEQAEDDDGGEDRERNRDGDDDRAAPTAEEEQDHQAGEHGGDDGLANDALDRSAHEDGLVADGLDDEFEAGESRATRGSRLANAVDDVEGRGVAGLENGDAARRGGRPGGRCWSGGCAVADGGDVAKIDGGAVDLLDGEVADFLRG